MTGECWSEGNTQAAKFTMKLQYGDGMELVAMQWKEINPPSDIMGFGIEYRYPDNDRNHPFYNRLNFLDKKGKVKKEKQPPRPPPIQISRWVHFPCNADKDGKLLYRRKPVFMDGDYEIWIPDYEEHALVYLADERRQGIGYPAGLDETVEKNLHFHTGAAKATPSKEKQAAGE
jgi:hypothetical protein